MTAWYDYPITNPHSSDDGVDLGTPDNTPLSFPEGGQVIDASYHVYGGQVVVHTPEGWDEYVIHANRLFAQRGEHVEAGQVIATSGGGVGDLILKGGRVQPATSQSDYQGHSSGYHTEFGEFRDTSQFGDMGQFDQGWGNKARQADPTHLIAQLHAEGGPVAPPTINWSDPNTWGPAIAVDVASSQASPANATGAPKADWKDPNTWGPAIAWGLATSTGFTSPGNALGRAAAFGVALALIGGGLFIAIQPEVQSAVTSVAKVAGAAL